MFATDRLIDANWQSDETASGCWMGITRTTQLGDIETQLPMLDPHAALTEPQSRSLDLLENLPVEMTVSSCLFAVDRRGSSEVPSPPVLCFDWAIVPYIIDFSRPVIALMFTAMFQRPQHLALVVHGDFQLSCVDGDDPLVFYGWDHRQHLAYLTNSPLNA